jgi:hypothetical protein
MLALAIPSLLFWFATGIDFVKIYAGLVGLKLLVNILINGTALEQKNA